MVCNPNPNLNRNPSDCTTLFTIATKKHTNWKIIEIEFKFCNWTITKKDLFVHYLKHFVACIKPTESQPVLVALHGHASHKSIEAVEFARANHVHSITIPPHTSHWLQQLDLTFSGHWRLRTIGKLTSGCWHTLASGWQTMNCAKYLLVHMRRLQLLTKVSKDSRVQEYTHITWTFSAMKTMHLPL